ncbi:MAG: glutamine--tRNA ligase/YqeY domain fusion protein [Actinomycetota bacterium]|nr:glutamine--tRNA ligase/YqeY domain fusion protein [Actinomycetota bacterium]
MTADDRIRQGRSDFIRDIIEDDLRTGKHGGRLVTRFPPEPNGYLHIGHAKAICLNFGVAEEYGGHCNLRFDDTNPLTEGVEYVDSIVRDVEWLGFSLGDRAKYASDYFEEMYQLAEELIGDGMAYVDHLSDEDIKEYRGSLSDPGRPSPFRMRTVEENLALFREMRKGGVPDGSCVLRAKIDLASPNMKMRDPLLYRIRHSHHYRTGDDWPIYPMYDWAHPISDGVEGVTHSICTLEFENNRELYDWVIDRTRVSERHGFSRPHQYEFARLNLDYTVMSKRLLLALVEQHDVNGWDDPRMPTIAGMRRRGIRPEAIRAFADLVGVAKVNSTVDIEKLEFCVRDDLNWTAPRVLGVLRPLKVIVASWPEGKQEVLAAPYFPPDVGEPGERTIPFQREILIEREDFLLDPPAGYQRLAPGRTVRLRYGPCITCDDVVTEMGEPVEIRCHHVPDSVGTNPPGVKISGVIHWVPASGSVTADVRLYDRLFLSARPEDPGHELNPDSVAVVNGARLEPSMASAEAGSRWQLERVGYFVYDSVDSRPGAPVLNRIVTLRDTWQGRAQPAVSTSEHKPSRTSTRPPKRSRIEYRAEARVRDGRLAERFATWSSIYGLSEDEVDLLTGDRPSGDLFEAAVATGAPPAAVARWMINDLPRELGDRLLDETPLTGRGLGALVRAAASGEITGAAAKEVFKEMLQRGGDPAQIIAERGLAQISDEAAVAGIVDVVLAANQDKVEQYRNGKTGLLGFFVGQVVRSSQGNANPGVVRRLLGARLD